MAVSSNKVNELRRNVQYYKPGSEVHRPHAVIFPKHLHIGLFGMTGCGKSSCINSIKFAAAGDLKKKKWLQVAPQLMAGGHTLYRKAVHISNGIYVVDNRGLDDPSTDHALNEIAAQLDGKRGYAEVVEWQENKREEEEFGANAISGDIEYEIGCAVLVFSAVHDREFSTAGLEKFIALVCNRHGRYPMGVITNVDRVEKSVVEKLRILLLGKGISEVCEVANITEEKEKLEEKYQEKLLSLLDRCMVAGDESYIFKHHARVERIRKEKQAKKEWKQQEQKTRMEEDRKAKLHEDKEVQNLKAAMEKMMKEKMGDEDRYQQAIQIAELQPTPQVTVVASVEKKFLQKNTKAGVGALSAGAAGGAILGSVAGPPGACVGAAVGGLFSGVGYLFGKEQ